MPSSNLYQLLPSYLRLFDDDEKIIKFICDQGIQPEIDIQLAVTRRLPDYFDLSNSLSWDRLDWLGQLVGLGAIEGHYLGIGINPNWGIDQKIKLIENAGDYWKQKGTEAGVRQAIELWLNWEKQSTKLTLRSPFDDFSGWWEYDTPYDFNEGKTFKQQKAIGGGDYAQDYQPSWTLLQTNGDYWQYDIPWNNQEFVITPAPVIQTQGSRMGARNVYLDFAVDEQDWRSLFPDYHTLALEIFPVLARQHPIIYFEMAGAIVSIPRIPPDTNTGKLIDFDVDGYHYDWEYPYPAVITPESYLTTETITTNFGGEPGFEYGENLGELGRSQTITTSITTQSPDSDGLNYGDCYGGFVLTSSVDFISTPFDTVNYALDYDLEYGGVWSEAGEFNSSSVVDEVTAIAGAWAATAMTFTTISTTQEIIPPAPALPWTINPQTVTETITTVVNPPAIVSCNLGVLAKIETGKEWVTEITPGVPSDILLEVIPASTSSVVTPAVADDLGWQWGDAYIVELVHLTDVVSGFDNGLTVEAIAPVSESLFIEFAVNTLIDRGNVPAIPWHSLGTPETTEVITIPSGYAMRSPWLFDWDREWGGEYPFLGTPQIERLIERPVTADYRICNVPANWTTQTIVRYQEIILPPTVLDLPITELYPLLPIVLDGNQWQLLIETTIGVICQKPTNIFLQDGEGDYLDIATGGSGESLYLEFTLTGVDCSIASFTLNLGDRVVSSKSFASPLDWSRQATLSVSSAIALNYVATAAIV